MRKLVLLVLLFLPFAAVGEGTEPKTEQPQKPLSGWFTMGGIIVKYEGNKNVGSFGTGISAGFGKILKGKPLALGMQCVYRYDKFWEGPHGNANHAQTIGARPFLRTYVFSRGPIGASFDTSLPLSLKMGTKGAECLTAGVSLTPTVVYKANRRISVSLSLGLFELSYRCTVPLKANGAPLQHGFTAGFLNMGKNPVAMGITWNL